jgi:hypothetical protein
VGSVSSISAITIFLLSFYCSEKREQNRSHDWNWAMWYSLEMMSSSRSLRLSVTKPHHAYVSLPRQPYKQEKHPKTIIEVPTSCASISRQFGDERAMPGRTLPLIRRLLSTHEDLYLVQHCVLAWRAVAMPRIPVSGRRLNGDRCTAASSTGRAPFAILCLPVRGLLAYGRSGLAPSC